MKRDNIITAVLLIATIGLFAFNNIDKSTEGSFERKTVLVNGDEVKVGLNLGNKAPELNFADPNGKMIALSDLKGKMVLIDFWASWCRPCRYENPNLVKAYKKYKDVKFENAEGFTVYSVSLDRSKGAWQNAIMQDKLSWPSHVSDLKFWSSEGAKIYGVRSIPSAFLIDGDGIIVGKGNSLRGGGLAALLNNLKKS